MRRLFLIACLLTCVPCFGNQDPLACPVQGYIVNMQYQTGGTFSGVVDIDCNHVVTGVSGTLYGSSYGSQYNSSNPPYASYAPPNGLAIDTAGYFFQSGASEESGYLEASADYATWIDFSYLWTAGGIVSTLPTGTIDWCPPDGCIDNENGVYYVTPVSLPGDPEDPLYEGNITPTPEPSSLLLFGSGILGLAGMIRGRLR